MEQKWKAGNLRTMWSSEENRVRKGKNYGRGNRWKEISSSTDKDQSVGHGHFQGNRNLRVKTCIYCNWEVLYLCYPGKIWQSHWDMFSNRQAGVLCQNLDSVQKFVAEFSQSDCSCDVCM